MRQGAPQPGQVFVVNDEGQMVVQGAQGGDAGSSDAGGGTARARPRKGAQQRARDIVQGGLDQMREWGSDIVAEMRLLQASQPTSCSRTMDTEDRGGTGQSTGPEQGRFRDSRRHEEGASTWMVRAAPNSILGKSLSRGRCNEAKNENEESGGWKSEPKASTGVQSRVAPLTQSREENYKQHMANFSQRPGEQRQSGPAKSEAAATARCPEPQPREGPHSSQSIGAEAQPRVRHTAAQQRCEGHSVLAVRCEAAKGAELEAEHTLMAGVAKQEAAERAGGDVPSLHEKLERKEKLEGETTVGAAYATTAGPTGQLLSMAERLGDQSQKAGTLTRSFEVSFDTDRVKQAVSQVPLFNSEGGPDSDPDESFSMLASEEEDNAKHSVQGSKERGIGRRRSAASTRSHRERATQKRSLGRCTCTLNASMVSHWSAA